MNYCDLYTLQSIGAMPVCLSCSPHDNDKMILTIAVMPIDDLHKNAGQLAVDPQQLSKVKHAS